MRTGRLLISLALCFTTALLGCGRALMPPGTGSIPTTGAAVVDSGQGGNREVEVELSSTGASYQTLATVHRWVTSDVTEFDVVLSSAGQQLAVAKVQPKSGQTEAIFKHMRLGAVYTISATALGNKGGTLGQAAQVLNTANPATASVLFSGSNNIDNATSISLNIQLDNTIFAGQVNAGLAPVDGAYGRPPGAEYGFPVGSGVSTASVGTIEPDEVPAFAPFGVAALPGASPSLVPVNPGQAPPASATLVAMLDGVVFSPDGLRATFVRLKVESPLAAFILRIPVPAQFATDPAFRTSVYYGASASQEALGQIEAGLGKPDVGYQTQSLDCSVGSALLDGAGGAVIAGASAGAYTLNPILVAAAVVVGFFAGVALDCLPIFNPTPAPAPPSASTPAPTSVPTEPLGQAVFSPSDVILDGQPGNGAATYDVTVQAPAACCRWTPEGTYSLKVDVADSLFATGCAGVCEKWDLIDSTTELAVASTGWIPQDTGPFLLQWGSEFGVAINRNMPGQVYPDDYTSGFTVTYQQGLSGYQVPTPTPPPPDAAALTIGTGASAVTYTAVTPGSQDNSIMVKQVLDANEGLLVMEVYVAGSLVIKAPMSLTPALTAEALAAYVNRLPELVRATTPGGGTAPPVAGSGYLSGGSGPAPAQYFDPPTLWLSGYPIASVAAASGYTVLDGSYALTSDISPEVGFGPGYVFNVSPGTRRIWTLSDGSGHTLWSQSYPFPGPSAFFATWGSKYGIAVTSYGPYQQETVPFTINGPGQ